MDYTFNSSDILFPGDVDIPKLTSPMYAKVPEGIDWANQDLMDTFNDKSSQELAHFLSLKKRIKVSDNNDDENENDIFGPLKSCKQHSDEKKLCQALSSIYNPSDQRGIHDMLKEVFDMVQNDIQKNTHGYPPYFAEPFLSWKDEIWNDGNAVGSVEDISDFEPKLQHRFANLEQPPVTSRFTEPNYQNDLPISVTSSITKEKKQPSKSTDCFKEHDPKNPFKSFYKKAKKNIKAITSKLLHI